MKLHSIVALVSSLFGILIATKISLFWMIGSATRFPIFSLNAVMIPGSALSGGFLIGFLITLIRLAAFIGAGKVSAALLVQFVPGLCATVVSQKHGRFLNYFIPLSAMILFAIHPTGASVAWYTLYWMIPMIIAYCGYQSLFVRALNMSFIAHAVGSVIWIYTVPMTSADYYTLALMVPFERLVIAGGIYGYCTLVNYATFMIKKAFASRRICFDLVGR